MPDSVTEIGSHAFNGCANLTKVILPYHLSSIPSFDRNDRLETDL